jgi:hypothetical protein
VLFAEPNAKVESIFGFVQLPTAESSNGNIYWNANIHFGNEVGSIFREHGKEYDKSTW